MTQHVIIADGANLQHVYRSAPAKALGGWIGQIKATAKNPEAMCEIFSFTEKFFTVF